MARNFGPNQLTSRNPRPARGRDILTCDQIRRYLNLFWTDRSFGICHLAGGKAAFLRFCGDGTITQHILTKLITKRPQSEYLSSQLQRILSRKILQVLRGEVIFVETGPNRATYKPLFETPQPPRVDHVPIRDHEFLLRRTILGPRITKLPAGV